jgi:hypothetical protein
MDVVVDIFPGRRGVDPSRPQRRVQACERPQAAPASRMIELFDEGFIHGSPVG